ncbi:MAG TPA: diguanylate cyclase [Acidimicrobiales bacterium]|nr:diguanylate cyclase [Acidimicrobiales bacterium]
MTESVPGGVRLGLSESTVLEREARIVGIRGFSTPSLEAVDRRRSQLWTIAFAGLACLATAVGLLTSAKGHELGFANRLGFRIGTVVLVVALAGYVMEKERHLRRLSNLLVNERVLGAALSNRLKELAVLYEAGKALNSVLVIEEVLQLILSSAFELLEASSGYIMLLEGADELVVACRAGVVTEDQENLKLGESIAARVVRDREPLLIQGSVAEKGRIDTESAVCVPLIHRDGVLGVLILKGAPDHVYSEHDLRAVSLFAEHAAIAVANARLYEAERALSVQLSHQVVHDPLTGAANRVLVADRLNHALARVRRGEGLMGVLFIDVDDFKVVNDELGHGVGDHVLTAIAQRLGGCVRPSDTVGRYGGDEFVIVCEDLADDDGAGDIADRVLEQFAVPFPTPAGGRLLSASIGVVTCGAETPVEPDAVIRAADRAMYRAKMEGKARIVRAGHPARQRS